MKGTTSSATLFSPNTVVTRAMVVTTLYRMSGEHETGNYNPFYDVPESYYTEAVLWASHHGIVNGVAPHQFNPNDPVTREQCLTVMYRYAIYKGLPHTHTESITGAPDYWDIHEFARDAMSWALSYSILLRGTQNSYLYPQANTDRKWLAVYLARFRRNVEGIDWAKDKFSFRNMSSDFLSGEKNRYLISDSDMNRLFSLAGNNESLKQLLRDKRNCAESEQWNGSCYGMALAVVLNALGKINFAGNTTNGCKVVAIIPSPINCSSTMHQRTQDTLTTPYTTITEVESKINMYQLSMNLPNMHIWSTISPWGESQQLANLIDGHELSGISILFYSYYNQRKGHDSQHAVVCFGKPQNTINGYKVKIYDPRYYSDNCWLEVNTSNWQGTVVTTNNDGELIRDPIIDCTYCDYFECFNNSLDFDGIQNTDCIPSRMSAAINDSDGLEINDMPAHTVRTDDNSYISLTGKTILYIESNGAFKIENAEGQQFEYAGGKISGTLPVYCYSLLPSGENSPCTYEFIVDDSSSFTCSSLTNLAEVVSFCAYSDNQSVSVANETMCTKAN